MTLVPWARTDMPNGETPFLLGSNANVLLILTATSRQEENRNELRVYRSEVLDQRFSYSVGQMQLKREWLAVEHEPLETRKMAATRDEILWWVKEVNVNMPDNPDRHPLECLWRFDVVTGGVSRDLVVAAVPGIQEEQTNLNGFVVFNDIFGGIDYAHKKILLGDKDHYQDFGYVIFPNVNFGLNTEISWVAATIDVADVRGGSSGVELWGTTDPAGILSWNHPSWSMIQNINDEDASGVEIPLGRIKAKTMALQVRLRSYGENMLSPKVRRVAVRGIPSHRDFVMVIPVNVSDYVSVPGRAPIRHPGLGATLHTAILDLVGQSVEATLLQPPILFRGVVNNVSEPVTYVSERGSSSVYVEVEFLGQRMTATAPPTGNAGIGLGLLGVATVGMGQMTYIETGDDDGTH